MQTDIQQESKEEEKGKEIDSESAAAKPGKAMGCRQALAAENASGGKIVLLREGAFWRAYERSAFALVTQVSDLKPVKRVFKSLDGQEVVRDLVSVLQNIYRANRYRDKVPYIGKALEQMTEAQLQIRLLKDLHAIALKPYARLSLKSETVLKELAGWKGYSQKS